MPFFEITYGTGEIQGQLMQDHVKMGELIIKDQVFGGVTEQEGDAFIGVPFAGIIGLGSAKLSVAGTVPIFDHMKNLGLIRQKIFAVYMSNVNNHRMHYFSGFGLLWRSHFRQSGNQIHGGGLQDFRCDLRVLLAGHAHGRHGRFAKRRWVMSL